MPTTIPERKPQTQSVTEKILRAIISILLLPWFVLGLVKYWVLVWKYLPF